MRGRLMTRSIVLTVFTVFGLTAACVSSSRAAEQVGPDAKVLAKCRERAINFLKTSQAEDGSWTTPSAIGITGLAVTALLDNKVPADDPVVQRGLACLLRNRQEDGGIYYAKGNHRNYETCIAVMALEGANEKGAYTEQIAAAEKFLRKLQWDEGEGLESSDTAYGGAGYGSHERPDLSNTQFLLEALKAAGASPHDPAMQKALVFVSRSQNLETEHNTTPFAAKINDGGFFYTPAAGGSTKAEIAPNGGLRSYASMTYAGLKSMIYAGLTPEDQRVQAAMKWISKHYSLTENPGVGQQGLFYYYHTFAKALAVLEIDCLIDDQQVKHDWRKELVARLVDVQQPNGSWVNREDRWYESDPNLVTAYSLMALAYCDPRPAATK